MQISSEKTQKWIILNESLFYDLSQHLLDLFSVTLAQIQGGHISHVIMILDKGYKLFVVYFLPNTFEPHHEKTCLRGLQPGKTQTSLLSFRE